MITLTRQQARQIDHLAVTQLGIPSIVLMENAGLNAVAAINRFMAEQPGVHVAQRPWTGGSSKALIFCGGGNNAGDGYVIARHLHNQGISIQIIALKPIDQLTPDAAINATICKNMGLDIQPAPSTSDPSSPPISQFPALAEAAIEAVPISSFSSPPDLIIDALLGTGFQGNLRPDTLQLIHTINATRDLPDPPKVIAIDLPSGLDCDTGQPPQNVNADQPPGKPAQDAIRADLTITFVAPKIGFTNPAAKPYLGQVVTADIGTPPEMLAQITSP